MSPENKKILITIVGLVLVLSALFVFFGVVLPSKEISPQPGGPGTGGEPQACTLEAKICPDGTAVGRTGPNCEFAACPEPVSYPKSWKRIVDEVAGVEFYYPEILEMEYISTVDWPPQVQLLDEPIRCNTAGQETSRGGRTAPETIDGRTYCVTRVSEGAAGSTYAQYAYAFESVKLARPVVLIFSLKFVQCGNYNEPQKTACQQEQEFFEFLSTVDAMAQSLTPLPH